VVPEIVAPVSKNRSGSFVLGRVQCSCSNSSSFESDSSWQPLSSHKDATFLQINSDDTCRQSYSLDGLTDVPEVECTYIFDGTYFSLTAVKLNGVPECPSLTGKYEVRLISEDQIELIAAKDNCAPRIMSTRGEYQRIP